LIVVLLVTGPVGLGLVVDRAAAQQAVVQPIGNLITTWSVDQANAIAKLFDNNVIPGVTDPFGYKTPVTQIDPTQTLFFVRFVTNPANPYGGWIMRSSEVRGLTAAQIKDKFALENTPPYIVSVAVPPSPPSPNKYGLLTGIAGAIWSPGYYWGQGGGQQTRIIKGQTQDATYNFMDYAKFIPTTSYYHVQPIGTYALQYAPMVGSNGNAGRVAAYLDKFIPQPYSDMENVYTLLDYLNYPGYGPGPLRAAMQQISPERYDALSFLGLRANLLFGDALMQRSQTLRLGLAGGTGEPAAALPETLGQLAKLAYVSSFSDPRTDTPGMLPSQVSQRGLGIWARGVGEFGNLGSSGDRTGFAYNTGGFVGGVDWQPCRDVILGFGAAYLGTGLNWDQRGGNGNVNYAKFGLYGSYFTPRWFVDGVFSGGVNWADTTRNIFIMSDSALMPVINRQAGSNQTGHDFTVQWRGGVNLSLENWYLTPMAGLAYFYLHQDPFTENGADSLNLNVQANEAQTLRSTLGARLAQTFTTPNGGKITPEASIGWAHDFALDNRVINASLIALGGAFATNGFNADTDTLLVGAGVTAQLTNGVALSGRYQAEFGQSFASHMVNLGVRCEF
jgi:outer membrane autotransporter protein